MSASVLGVFALLLGLYRNGFGCAAAVKQRLWRLRLRAGTTCASQDAVTNSSGAKIGFVTSVATVEGTTFALAYLKSKVDGERVEWEGVQVQVGEAFSKVTITLRTGLAYMTAYLETAGNSSYSQLIPGFSTLRCHYCV